MVRTFLYGLDMPHLGDAMSLTGPRSESWFPLDLRVESGNAPDGTAFTASAGRAELTVAGDLSVRVRREPGFTAVVTSPRPVADSRLVHPVLAFVGAVVARWTDRVPLHAASVVVGGRAWLLAAPPEGGKSTAAACLAERGHPVLADDLTVLAGRTVLAGPRSADLREPTVTALEGLRAGADAVPGGRWRRSLGAAPHEAPLGGIVLLEWGERFEVRPLGPVERLAALAAHDALSQGPASPAAFLDLLDVPMYAVRRPRRWDALESSLSALERLLTTGGA